MDLNKATIIGNLTRDPEVRTTPSGINVANFGVATNLVWNDQNGQRQEKAEFHNVVAWRKLADICGQYLKKGGKVYIEGRLQTRSWDDQNGVKRYRTEIIADNMIMLDRAGQTPGGNYSQPQPPQNNSQPEPTETEAASAPEEKEINVDDIPF
ncbi:single-stranded DNA-binding protein [Patescibacteria group bacterium]|nr:single-stranded DNA-binding protein [Patescibacteria group bacterium]